MTTGSPSLAGRLAAGALSLALASIPLVTRAAAPAGRYTISSGTVRDTKTGLVWQQAATTSNYTWGSASTSGTAQNYCATLSLNGAGWRLPTMKELTTLVDFSVPSPGPMIDTTAFPGTPADFFWSSTPLYGSPNNAWLVGFANGATHNDGVGVSSPHCVRCVH